MNLKNLEKLLWLSEKAPKVPKVLKVPKAFCIAEISSDKSVKLIEKAKNAKYEFNIAGVSDGTLVIKCPPDQCRFFVSNKKGYTSICDYLIFIPNNQKVTVIFCELKKTLDGGGIGDGGKQIKSTIPMLKYILAGIETHFGEKWKIEMCYTIIAKHKSKSWDKNKLLLKNNVQKINGLDVKIIIHASDIPISSLMYKRA